MKHKDSSNINNPCIYLSSLSPTQTKIPIDQISFVKV